MRGRRDLSNAEVPQFYNRPAVVVEAVEEDISGLYVAMQNFAVVDVLNAAAELEKPAPDAVLVEEFSSLSHLFDLPRQVASTAVLLNNAKRVWRCEVIDQLDNIRVIKHLKQLGLLDEISQVLALHLRKVDLFHAQVEDGRI